MLYVAKYRVVRRGDFHSVLESVPRAHAWCMERAPKFPTLVLLHFFPIRAYMPLVIKPFPFFVVVFFCTAHLRSGKFSSNNTVRMCWFTTMRARAHPKSSRVILLFFFCLFFCGEEVGVGTLRGGKRSDWTTNRLRRSMQFLSFVMFFFFTRARNNAGSAKQQQARCAKKSFSVENFSTIGQLIGGNRIFLCVAKNNHCLRSARTRVLAYYYVYIYIYMYGCITTCSSNYYCRGECRPA